MWTWWYDNGQKALEGTLSNVQSGIYVTEFNRDSYSVFIVAGLADGKWTCWYSSPSYESIKRGRGHGKRYEVTIKKNWIDVDPWERSGLKATSFGESMRDYGLKYRTRSEILKQ